MTRLFFATVFCILFAFTSFTFGQATPTPTPTPEENEEIIRISSELVLIDALVLDKKGNQVKDLNPDDFEVYQDGKLQKITNFSYVDGASSLPKIKKEKRDKKSIPPPPFNPRSNSGRLITFVVDDGCDSPGGLANARGSIKDFIKKSMQPSDKVAIYRTRGGSSLLQAYTSNKEVLTRVANRIRWFPTRGCERFSAPAVNAATLNPSGQGATTFENDRTKDFLNDISNEGLCNQTRISTNVLKFAIDRLKVLPQRKMVFFVSGGISWQRGLPCYDEILSDLRDIADKAVRSSVVLYTMNTAGVSNPGFISAQDDVPIGGSDALSESRRQLERGVDNALVYLADQTGGKAFLNRNFLNNAINESLDKETGYYLLGYEPDSNTFKGKKFHNIEVKLKRDNLNISSRRGFYGSEDQKTKQNSKNANSPLYQAIAAPFDENGIDIRLTTLTENDSKKGNYIRTIFHIAGKDLTFTDDSKGLKKVVLDVVAVALDEKGKVAAEFNRTYPIRIPQRGVEIIKKNGLDYSTDIPIKKHGFYSLRLVVRDQNSKRIGSAGDTIDIPNPKKNQFFINGLLTTSVTNKAKPLLPKERATDAGFAPVFTTSIPSIRQYKAGEPFAYIYKIHNAKIESKTRKPNLTTQFKIFKDGTLLTESKETPIELEPQADMSQIQDYGLVSLNENADIGEYVLQLIIKDNLANKISTQWIDFEITQ